MGLVRVSYKVEFDSAPLDADVDGLKCGERTRPVLAKTAPSVGIAATRFPAVLGRRHLDLPSRVRQSNQTSRRAR